MGNKDTAATFFGNEDDYSFIFVTYLFLGVFLQL